jgi:hypothetical protein
MHEVPSRSCLYCLCIAMTNIGCLTQRTGLEELVDSIDVNNLLEPQRSSRETRRVRIKNADDIWGFLSKMSLEDLPHRSRN